MGCRGRGGWLGGGAALAGGLGLLGLAPALLLVGLDLGLDAPLGLEIGRLLGLFLLYLF